MDSLENKSIKEATRERNVDKNLSEKVWSELSTQTNRADRNNDGLPDNLPLGKPTVSEGSDREDKSITIERVNAGSYRYLTSLELVSAICVAAVGLAKLRKPERPELIQESNFEQKDKEEAIPDAAAEEAKLVDVDPESAWIAENHKGKSLKQVKSEVVVCSLDRQLNFVSFSDTLSVRWGYQANELIGHSFIGLLRAEDRNGALAALREILANKTGLAFENWLRHKDGSYRAISWSAYWSDSEGRIVAIARDITADKELEKRRQEAVQMVSHDLRSPLTSIQFSLELLAAGASGTLPDEALEDVRVAQNNTTQLINLVNDLLDLEKIEHGVLRMNPSRMLLSEIIQSSIETVRFLARSRKIEIKATPSNLVVFADKERIVQVIVNMLSNAIKFSADGTSIAVNCGLNHGLAEVKVIDQGPGIPAKYKDEIFERFRQIEGREGVGQKGAGLGLAICKSIIDGHEGEIGVESKEGVGSTFWFRIPLFEKQETKTPFAKVAKPPERKAI